MTDHLVPSTTAGLTLLLLGRTGLAGAGSLPGGRSPAAGCLTSGLGRPGSGSVCLRRGAGFRGPRGPRLCCHGLRSHWLGWRAGGGRLDRWRCNFVCGYRVPRLRGGAARPANVLERPDNMRQLGDALAERLAGKLALPGNNLVRHFSLPGEQLVSVVLGILSRIYCFRLRGYHALWLYFPKRFS
jgi:hypothetical protein